MKKKEKFFCAVAMLLFYVAVFVFFAFVYGFHVINQEQLQLFENTREYFLDTVFIPGGLVDYISRFLTQFFFYSWSGALIITLLIFAAQAIVLKLIRNISLLNFAISFLPSALLVAMLCQRFAPINSAVAILFCLAIISLLLQIRKTSVRRVSVLAVIPVAYFIAGPAVVLIPLTAILKERKLWFAVISVALTALCPVIAYLFLHYNLLRLLWGLNYYKMHYDLPVWSWIAIVGTFAVVLVSEFTCHSVRFIYGGSAMVVVIAGSAALVASMCNLSEEKELMYQILTVKRAWPSIVSVSVKQTPDTYNGMACVNMALSKTGHMGGHMFDYPQSGTEGLIPNTSASQHDRLFIGEIYFQLGLVNNARRYCTEAMAYVPDYQNSAPIFALLAEINIVDEHFVMAKKYLNVLSHTIFYRKWANGLLSRFDEFAKEGSTDEYSQKRFTLSREGKDYFFDYEDIGANLLQLVSQRPDNITALNYLLAIDLLNKNLELFSIHCPFNGYVSSVPKSYQEAFLLDWKSRGWSFEELPEFIDPAITAKMISFQNDYDAGQPMNIMIKKYSNSYWIYYSFR